jgi:hypothetical protein
MLSNAHTTPNLIIPYSLEPLYLFFLFVWLFLAYVSQSPRNSSLYSLVLDIERSAQGRDGRLEFEG